MLKKTNNKIKKRMIKNKTRKLKRKMIINKTRLQKLKSKKKMSKGFFGTTGNRKQE